MAPKKTTAAAKSSAANSGQAAEPLQPGHTRSQGSRNRYDEQGKPLTTSPDRSSDDEPA